MARTRTVTDVPRRAGSTRRAAARRLLVLLLLAAPLAPLSPGRVPVAQAAGAPLTGAGNTVVRNGRIEVDGQPFFPFGFYYTSWSQSEQQMIDTLRTIAAAGFSTMHVSMESGYDRGAFYDEAARLGIRLIAEGINANEVGLFKSKPATLGWNIGDDVHTNISPSELAQRHAAVKAGDPNHLTYFTVYDVNTWGPYLDKGDLVAPYSYPLTWGGLGEVDKALNEARQAGRPMIGIAQAFNWEGDRLPTPAEARNMSYQYLINNVQGLLMYNFNENGQLLPSAHPALWNEYKALVPEINTLAPALTSGTFAKLDAGGGGVLAARWSYGGQTYLVVLNTGEQGARQVSLPLPSGAIGAARPLFAGRPAGLVASNGRLTGTINPQDVHVYVFDGAGPSPSASPPAPSPSPSPSTTPPRPSASPSPAIPPIPSSSPFASPAAPPPLPSASPPVSPPSPSPSTPVPGGTACAVGQWQAEYFNNKTLGGNPALVRCEAVIRHVWNYDSPAAGIQADGFSVRWTGQFDFAAGRYTFTGRADDGVRASLDGVQILAGWRNQAATTYTGSRDGVRFKVSRRW